MIEDSFLVDLIKKPDLISKLDFEKISEILGMVRDIFEKENLLLEFSIENSEDIFVIGDIHGNMETLMKIMEFIEKEKPKFVISLGDIVDRGPKQLECLILVLALKILKPNQFFILQGNHETFDMNNYYGFLNEFIRKFRDPNKFKEILAVYNVLPICAVINNSILCLHGGIPENEHILKQLKGLKHSDLDDLVQKTIGIDLFQIMWNDPKETGVSGFSQSFRGPGIFFFGKDAFKNFMESNNLKYLIRAHECFPEGYRWFFDKRLLSIFSAANYRGPNSNPASYAVIKNNKIFLKTLK